MSYTQDWFTHNIPIWQQFLLRLTGQPLKALEIGSYEGRSTVWLLENILTHPDSKIICVDPYKEYSDLENNNIDWQQIKERFIENVSPYKEKVELWEIESSELGKADYNQFDIIYVDGDHSSHQTLVDGVLSHLLLKSGGIIIFDDYLWGGLFKAPNTPKGAIDAFMDCLCDKYQVLHIGYQVILKKI